MGYKSRGNYALSFKLTQEKFNKIFYKEKQNVSNSHEEKGRIKRDNSSTKNDRKS
jgi:hypothetical protein